MSVLGSVSVNSAKIVKVAAVIGMGISAASLLFPAIGAILYGPAVASALAPGLIGLAASIAGWEFADWAEGKLHVNNVRSVQEAELQRLQGQQARAL